MSGSLRRGMRRGQAHVRSALRRSRNGAGCVSVRSPPRERDTRDAVNAGTGPIQVPAGGAESVLQRWRIEPVEVRRADRARRSAHYAPHSSRRDGAGSETCARHRTSCARSTTSPGADAVPARSAEAPSPSSRWSAPLVSSRAYSTSLRSKAPLRRWGGAQFVEQMSLRCSTSSKRSHGAPPPRASLDQALHAAAARAEVAEQAIPTIAPGRRWSPGDNRGPFHGVLHGIADDEAARGRRA